ncbi:MAG: lambda-exonuclease family protein [Candidatus Thorarchaeota archaeon]
MKKIDLTQQSPEWHKWRDEGIGASDAPIIMDISPFCTPHKLWQRKIGIALQEKISPMMQRGIDLEQQALEAYMDYTGKIASPACFESDEYNFIRASLDGYGPDGAVEIKIPGTVTYEKARAKEIEPWYYCQMQHQMFVTGLKQMDFWVYNEREGGILLEVKYNETHIKAILIQEKKFFELVQGLIPPPLSKKDYVDQNNNVTWIELSEKWKVINKNLKSIEKQEKDLRKQLIKIAEKRNSIGNDIQLTFSAKKGNINYDEIPELKNVDLEKYRKSPVEFCRLSIKDSYEIKNKFPKN